MNEMEALRWERDHPLPKPPHACVPIDDPRDAASEGHVPFYTESQVETIIFDRPRANACVEELHCTFRTYNGIKNADIQDTDTLREVLRKEPSRLLRQRNFWKASLRDAKLALCIFDLGYKELP